MVLMVADAAAYRLRKSVLERRDPSAGMFRTHTFGAADTAINTGVSFPVRSKPISLAVSLIRTGAAPDGMVFELGDSTTGLAIWVNGPDVGFAAGDAGDDGAGVVMVGALPAVGARFKFVCAAIPGSGAVFLWRNGRLEGDSIAVNADFPNGWSSSSLGAVGETNGTANSRASETGTLTDVDIIGDVSMYLNQRPFRHTAP